MKYRKTIPNLLQSHSIRKIYPAVTAPFSSLLLKIPLSYIFTNIEQALYLQKQATDFKSHPDDSPGSLKTWIRIKAE